MGVVVVAMARAPTATPLPNPPPQGGREHTFRVASYASTSPEQAYRVPVLNAIAGMLWIGMLVVLGAVEGTSGPNRFGPDPIQAKQLRNP